MIASAGMPWSTNTAPSDHSSASCGTFDVTAYYAHLHGRVASLDRGALQPVDRRHPQRHRPHRAVLREWRAASSISIGGARRACSTFADLTPPERINAQARIGENSLTIAWVQHSLTERCASYRFALEHLAVAEPEASRGRRRSRADAIAAADRRKRSGRGAALRRHADRAGGARGSRSQIAY